jgi:hypothetical protein
MDYIAMMFKERIANMPDDINDKDILAYAKNIIKEIKEENKKKKAEDAALNKKKRVAKKEVKVDEDGNVVPKKLNMYQKYIKDNQQRVKEQNPELTNTERFAKLAQEWQEYKKTIVATVETPKEKESEPSEIVEDQEVVVESVESPKKEKKDKKRKV